MYSFFVVVTEISAHYHVPWNGVAYKETDIGLVSRLFNYHLILYCYGKLAMLPK